MTTSPHTLPNQTDGGPSADPVRFTDLLHVEPTAPDVFTAHCHAAVPGRAFGGQIAAHSLAAAGLTVDEDQPPHSLHGYFVTAGRVGIPVDYTVERIRDGRSFATRLVRATQEGRTVFTLQASFARPERTPEHGPDMPDAPAPETLSVTATLPHAVAGADIFEAVLETRSVGDPEGPLPGLGQGPRQQYWLRARPALPDSQLLHACALTYMSDIQFALVSSLPHRHQPGIPQGASLDHSLWFHRPFRADDWLLMASDGPTYACARGLARGQLFTRDGVLAASVTQEALSRRITAP
ncbi:acyl-CoA thioesterase [Streptomyces adustus]|uniref:acyl-CoA thioesterase n=1 Tax=Streptomyces adustus TaxID=1609272 RepID=UPI003715B81A